MVFSLVLIIFQLGGRHFDIRTPLSVFGDGLFHLLMAKRLIAGDGYFIDSALGYPYGSNLYDFPGSDSLSMLFIYLVGKLTGSPFIAVNSYYIVGFPLATWSFALVARRMGIAIVPSVVGGILFTALPFHFLRLNHLYYTWYFVVPLYAWVGWKIYEWNPASRVTRAWWCRAGLSAIGLAVLASAGIYYAVFGMIGLMVAGILGIVERGSLRQLALSIAGCAVIVLTVLANTAPNTLYKLANGPNLQVADRVPQEADIYGLKIAQLLLPQPVHRVEWLREVNREYERLFPLVNENASSSLGLVGGLGFIGLLAFLVFGRRNLAHPTPARYFSVVVFAFLLIATIGGFASLFAFFVSPMIRAWNRISIFIAFFSIAAAMMALAWQSGRLRIYRWGGIASIVMAAVVLAIGLEDQVGNRCDRGCAASMQGHVNRQRYFFANVQKAVPPGAAIYTLPFMEFPETPPKNELETYSLAEGYLYTSGLKWSYGAMKGRDAGDKLYRELEKKPISEQIDAVKALGFTGILIDRRGYEDAGVAVESELKASGKVRLAVEQDFRALYVITP
ncbi:sugar translocase [Variovorax terrae]|uniref:Sugar translocase n=1 Tax=Variovorax terrae TaxID=2923278 RepID=A0A9X2ALN9_9BURK|nr:sugar translocase [Variovorax terrae]MCJ0761870.1 sugar translocase [Variovorax terrae]